MTRARLMRCTHRPPRGHRRMMTAVVFAALVCCPFLPTAYARDVPFTQAYLITDDVGNPEGLFVADLDSDGDKDVIVASSDNDKLAWYENSGTSPPFFTEHVVDGDPDGDGKSYTQRVFQVFAADLDGDADLDILSTSQEQGRSGKVAWYENDGGSPPSFLAQKISEAVPGLGLYAADLDNDDDVDVVYASGYDSKLAWRENDGGRPPTFTDHTISSSAFWVFNVYAADVDGDGDVDVVSAEYYGNRVVWYENDGASPPNFSEHMLDSDFPGAVDVHVADMDGDGATDIVAASQLSQGDRLALHKNAGGAPPSFTKRAIPTDHGPWSVFVVDLDGDGDMDILEGPSWAAEEGIAWFENDGGSPPSFTQRTIGPGSEGCFGIFGADLDGDSDIDVAATSHWHDVVVWYENLSPPVGFVNDVERGPFGWTSTGLWHIVEVPGTPTPLPTPPNRYAEAHSGTHSWYYGQDYIGNYDTGAANTGDLTSPLTTFPQDGSLVFWSFEQTEADIRYDMKRILISPDSGQTWELAYWCSGAPELTWYRASVDTAAFAGSAGHIKFQFDTIDNLYNTFRGWYVDDMVLDGTILPSLDDDMESGTGSWRASGLWHLVTANIRCGLAHSGSHSWWYGQDETGNYNTGARTQGTLESKPFNLPIGSQLRFASWGEVEEWASEGFDLRQVLVTTDGSTWQLVYTASASTTNGWVAETVDIPSYYGPLSQVAFTFDSVDELYNNHRGWYVDDVFATSLPPSTFEDDMESGPDKWTPSGLWHMVDTAADPYAEANSPTHSWWYGQGATGYYNTGAPNSGTLDSIAFLLGSLKALQFYGWEETESDQNYDVRQVYISTDQGITWSLIHTSDGSTQGEWQQVVTDLCSYGDNIARIRFKFDTIDEIYNDYRGWYVDDVRIMDAVQTGLDEDFEEDPTDWTGSGLWHLVDAEDEHYGLAHSGTKSYWYGRDQTGNYDTGNRSFGGLFSPIFTLPQSSALTFWSWALTELNTNYDIRQVWLSIDGGQSWASLYTSAGDVREAWEQVTIDLDPYAAHFSQISFYFDTIDPLYNNYRGWFVDDVVVAGE